MSNANDTASTATAPGTRKRWLAIVIGAFLMIGAAYGAYWALFLRNTQSTDDAYVSGNVVQITPQIAGTVVKIAADDTQFVKAGDTLVELDPADAKIAREQADAKLAKAVRDGRGLFAGLWGNLQPGNAHRYPLLHHLLSAIASLPEGSCW